MCAWKRAAFSRVVEKHCETASTIPVVVNEMKS